MKINCVWEHNGADTLLYAENFPGAYARGASLEEAARKMEREIGTYQKWRGLLPPEDYVLEIVQEQVSELQICDADSDVLFTAEEAPLSEEEYWTWKSLTLQSALDFQRLYEAIPDADQSCLPVRETFYGTVPRTARQMYEHTKSVNAYYFAEIDVETDNEGTILACRQRGFEALEQQEGFLQKPVVEGSYGEKWSVRKVLRRFLWHDRIHAKAMYRMAVKTFGATGVPDIFNFET